MKICRYLYKKQINWGAVEGNRITALKDNPCQKIKPAPPRLALSKVKLLPPAVPTKIVCVGLNYKDHAQELMMKIPSQPIIFLKPPSSLIGHKQKIIYPCGVKRLDYEAELAVVIGKKTKAVGAPAAAKHIFGYTCLNDVTARCLQAKDGQWTRAKSFDTFCPLGPWLETELKINDIKIISRLNGELKQQSSTKNLIFPVPYLISFISRVMTLYPGDIIATGTPAGVGPMQKGDNVEVQIQGIGKLVNEVKT